MNKLNGDEINHSRYDIFIDCVIAFRGQGSTSKDTYGEGHHIIPVCAGGKGSYKSRDCNIIGLYPEEHFVAHQILADDNPLIYSLVYAYATMAGIHSTNHDRYKLTAEEYKKAKEIYAKSCSIEARNRWGSKTQEEKEEWAKSNAEKLKNKSEDEKLAIKIKKQNTAKNRTVEEQYIVSNNQKQAQALGSDDYKKEIALKYSISCNNKTEEYFKHKKEKEKEFFKDRKWYNNGLEEHRFKIGTEPVGGKTGRLLKARVNMSNNHGYRTRIKCINTGEIFETFAEAGRVKGVSVKIIKARIKNKLCDKNGNYWDYAE